MLESGMAVVDEEGLKDFFERAKGRRLCRLNNNGKGDLQLPQTLEGVITSRMDRLPFDLLEVLKVSQGTNI